MAISRAVDDPDSTRDDLVDDVVDSQCPAEESDRDPIGPAPAGDHFDAFNASTWHLAAPAAPWYETKLAMWTAIVAGLAAVTLVVSVVLLICRGSSDSHEAPLVSHSSTTEPSTPTATAAPPPPPSPSPQGDAPVIARPNHRSQQKDSRPTPVMHEPATPPPTGGPVKATPARTPGS